MPTPNGTDNMGQSLVENADIEEMATHPKHKNKVARKLKEMTTNLDRFKRVTKHLDWPRLPLLKFMKSYKDITAVRQDIIGGITVGVFLIPQGLALASLAGIPPELGLYTSMIAPIVYSLFTTSQHCSTGPATMIAMFVAETIQEPSLPEEGVALKLSPAAVCILMTFLVGIVQVLAGFLGMGMLVSLLSDNVISGFGTAVALKLVIQQVPSLLGLPPLSSSDLHFAIYDIISSLFDADLSNLWSGIMGISVVLVLLLTRKVFKGLPGWVPLQLILMITCILVTWLPRLDRYGIKVMGSIPTGLPMPTLPTFMAIPEYLSAACMLTIISYMQHIAVVKVLAKKLKYNVPSNQELFASGFANLVSSFFGAMPTCGGPARSLLNFSIGVRTPLAGLFSGLTVLLCAAFLTPYLWYLPKPCLAGIIIAAGYSSLDFKEPLTLWKEYPEDAAIWLITFLVTSFLGIQLGLGISIVISWLLAVNFLTIPRHAVMCQRPGMAHASMGNMSFAGPCLSGPTFTTEPVGPVLVWRFDSPIFFANAQIFKDIVHKLVKKHHPVYFILDARAIVKVDAPAGNALLDVAAFLKEQKIFFLISNLRRRVQQMMAPNLVEFIGKHMMTNYDNEACMEWCDHHRRTEEWPSKNEPVESAEYPDIPMVHSGLGLSTPPSAKRPGSLGTHGSPPSLRNFEATSSDVSDSESEDESDHEEQVGLPRLRRLQTSFIAPCQVP